MWSGWNDGILKKILVAMFALDWIVCEPGSRSGLGQCKKESGWWFVLIKFCHIHFYGITL
jgi:hypothetical protein